MAADPQLELDERLREACSIGDAEAVRRLLGSGARVNGRNPVNGWTCLHWACRRGHQHIVPDLLDAGADSGILTSRGESAAQLTSKPEIKAMLGGNCPTLIDEDPGPAVNGHTELPIVPNYLANPPLPILESRRGYSSSPGTGSPAPTAHMQPVPTVTHPAPVLVPAVSSAQSQPLFWMGALPGSEQELVLKVRLHNPAAERNDFIEVELDRRELTYQALLRVTCQELGIGPERVERIRKLPNTLLRKDKDVTRLQDYQELELVLLRCEGTVLSMQGALTERPCYNPGAATLIY
ncbi:ankyrin repeat domain-containing protein 40 isoform X1 [Hypanus sabinus]|uniref:ankyrin repeat domain-containing protein 40 isoform X1 n=1 Tax=Hypanus sabinus TaxID=79690 RepID=UPI0028C394B1|nr:ankyrin repeat domain-containing protein 40 isoform X1 [Hypanus sabinus]